MNVAEAGGGRVDRTGSASGVIIPVPPLSPSTTPSPRALVVLGAEDLAHLPGVERPAPLPKHLKVLVAPISGMMAGALEITTLWPFEWAKVQTQLNSSTPKWTLLGEARRVGIGLYKGLPAMLVGVPLQVRGGW